ncbi:MAG: SMC-Scp complex subunit ScpB [Deltaproteobacteria bacterium]|nr:SMC-Scp complex subunit ScpB [Deltaproteobacteria bacterium]
MSKSLKLIVEALLFAADKPLAVREIRHCIPAASAADIKSSLKVLRYEYEAMGRSFALKEVATGFQFRSRNEYGSYILKMLQKSPSRLSRAAMETIAIIAYKQPILRHEIERFRGVDVGGILKTLLEKELVKILGRKDLPGRPLIYGTTKRFLEVFDLKNIESLPKLKEIKDFGTDEDEQPSPQQETAQDPENPDPIPDGATPSEATDGEAEDQQNPLPGGSDIETEGGRTD